MQRKSKEKKIYTCIIVVLELLIILVVARRCIKRPVSFDIDLSQIQIAEDNTGLLVSENGLKYDGLNSGSINLVEDIFFHAGAAYEINVEFEAEGDVADEDICSISVTLNDTEENSYSSVFQNPIPIYSGCHDMYGRVYIQGGGHGNLRLKYKGSMPVTFKRVSLVERNIWQFVKLFLLLLLFAIIDVWYIYSEKVHRKMQWSMVGVMAIFVLSIIPCLVDMDYSGHDIAFHLQRIACVAEELRNGQFPVRLYSTAYEGYGFAAPIFYGDFFLYLPAILYNMMFPLYACVQIYIVFVTLITVCISYYCFKRITQDTRLALAGTLLYVLCPYRITNIWIRFGVGEYTALAFLPLVILGMHEIYDDSKKESRAGVIPLGVGIALLLMCHMVTTELVVIVLALAALALYKRTFSSYVIKKLLLSVAVFSAVGAWVIVPMIHTALTREIAILHSDYIQPIQQFGTYFIQLINPVYSYGNKMYEYSMSEEMPLSIGIGAFLGILVPVWLALRERIDSEHILSARVKFYSILGTIVMIFTLLCFPWNELSRYCGKYLAKIINQCQFSWRYLGIATILLIVAYLLALKCLNDNYGRNLIVFSCIVSVFVYFHFFSDYVVSHEEYRHYAWPTVQTTSFDGFYLINSQDGTICADADMEIEDGCVTIINDTDSVQLYSIPVYAFLNIIVCDESGEKIRTTVSRDGLVEIEAEPNYSGTFYVEYKEPLLWRLSEIISVLTIAALLYVYLFKKKKVARSS